MGHEISVSIFKKSKYPTLNKALEAFIDHHSEDRCFTARSINDFKSCYISGTTESELVDSFEKVLEKRYGGYGSYATISLPKDEIFKSKKVVAIDEKIKLLNQNIEEIKNNHIQKMKDQKIVKCKDCKHIQSKVRNLTICEKCNKSLLKETNLTKISKIKEKIDIQVKKKDDIVAKAKKEECYIIGLEYHV